MSLKVKFLSFFALFAAFALFSVSSMAQDTAPQVPKDGAVAPQNPDGRGFGRHGGRGEGFRGGPGGREMMGMRGVNLTDPQKEQIKSIRESNRPDPATMQEMKTLWEAKKTGTLTPEQQARMKDLHQQAREKGEAVHKQIMAVLTPEQLQQMEQNRQDMKKRMQERRLERQQNKQTTPPATPDKPKDN
ncbi:MAG: Spy/CpxP family protein refolding chaperone [Acidobacteriota bacterium]